MAEVIGMQSAPAVAEITAEGLAGGPSVSLFPVARAKVYAWYVLALVWCVMLLRFVDLQIISVLMESIRKEFHASDTQLGLLSGTAFAIFYGALGVPIGWLADRANRRNLMSGCLALWSAMTALCGCATSMGALFLLRMAVGVGEAGGAPPSFSLVSDYFPASRRSTAFAVLSSATPFGVAVGLLAGGWANAYLGWRGAMIGVGIPGLVLAVLIRFTLREPARGAADRKVQAKVTSVGQTVRQLWGIRSYRHLVLATSIFTMGAMGSGIWIPSFFVRVHHMSAGEVAMWLACIYGGGGVLGTLAGGAVADRMSRWSGNRAWQARLPAIATAAILPFSFFVYLYSNPITALLVHTGTTFLMHSWMGPAYGTIQSVAGVSRRAMAASINLLATNLIALGLGPLLVGAASDYLNARLGADALRYSILTVVVVCYSWAAIHFLLASRTLVPDLEKAESDVGACAA